MNGSKVKIKVERSVIYNVEQNKKWNRVYNKIK